MANNYMHFSEVIRNITPAEAEWLETVLFTKGSKSDLAAALEVDKSQLDCIDLNDFPGFEFEIRTDKLWLYDNGENFNLENLVQIIQLFIRRWSPDYIFCMTWAETCSKPKPGEFGGGWAVVSKDEILHGSTWSAVSKAVEKIKGEK